MREKRSINDRVYDAIKADLLDAAYRPGEHIEAATLADSLSASVTPVRIALYRLAAERLLETHTGEGFYVPQPTEADLLDLYDWTQNLLVMALRIVAATPAGHLLFIEPTLALDNIPIATRQLFQSIADTAGHREIALAVMSANDRLQAFRSLKLGIVPDRDAELAAMLAHWRARDFAALATALTDYHARRRTIASQIVRRFVASRR